MEPAQLTITASAGGVDITAPGAAAGEDINVTATGSSVILLQQKLMHPQLN